jgi:hypothetical protein
VRYTIASVLTLLGAAAAIISVGAAWLFSPDYPPSAVLAADVTLVALVAGTGAVVWRRTTPSVPAVIPWMACGMSLGAVALAASTMAAGVFLAALLLAAAGVAQGLGGRRGLVIRLAATAVAAVANLAVLWVLLLSRYAPVDPTEFLAQDYRVHSLLYDVPLHDVWVFHLRDGNPPTVEDVRAILTADTFSQANPIVLGLIVFRTLLGEVLGWDQDACEDTSASYVHRLTDADRQRSQLTPEPNGFLYAFEHEALAEITNCTVHAFLAWGWKPTANRHDLYWAIYVKPVGDFTPKYMALIDPFRRLFIYPSIIRRVEQRWAHAVSQRLVAEPTPGASSG